MTRRRGIQPPGRDKPPAIHFGVSCAAVLKVEKTLEKFGFVMVQKLKCLSFAILVSEDD